MNSGYGHKHLNKIPAVKKKEKKLQRDPAVFTLGGKGKVVPMCAWRTGWNGNIYSTQPSAARPNTRISQSQKCWPYTSPTSNEINLIDIL